jgi:multiple sugar transport system permease protein
MTTLNYETGLRHNVLGKLPYVPLLLAAVVMILPYYWMVIGAFKSFPELQAAPPTFIVQNPTFDNFFNPDWSRDEAKTQELQGLFQNWPQTVGGFLRFYANSLIVATANTIAGLIVASIAAYVLSKHKFPGRNAIFVLILASMMVPWQVTLIPGFMIVRDFGWIDTYLALIIPAIPKAFTLFFLRQYMLSIPNDLIDAARVDGAGEVRIWWQVMLPLVVPAMIAMGLFMFLGEWNNLIWPLVVVHSQDMRTLPVIMSTMVSAYSTPTQLGLVMAASLLVSLPTLILFIVFQKQFVRGIALTGIKG